MDPTVLGEFQALCQNCHRMFMISKEAEITKATKEQTIGIKLKEILNEYVISLK